MGRFLRKITAVVALGPCPSVTHNLSFLACPKFPSSRCPWRGQSQGQSQGLSGSGQQKPRTNQGVSDQKVAFKAWLQLPASLCVSSLGPSNFPSPDQGTSREEENSSLLATFPELISLPEMNGKRRMNPRGQRPSQ